MAIKSNTSSVVPVSPALPKRCEAKKTRVIAFTSGKGGVGKTSLSVNLALALARSGSKVCLFDADMGMANVNIMLGITPAYTLEHLFTDEKSIEDIVVTGPAGLDIIPGASGFSKCVDLEGVQQQRLVSALQYLEPKYDYLIIDTSAGISSTVLHFVAAAQMAAIVITPEPTSLTDAFSLLKVLRRRGYKRIPQVVVNMAKSAVKAESLYRRFDAAVKKYIGLGTEYLGYVWMDESIRASVTLQRPVSLLPESDPSCKSFYRLADSLDNAYNRGKVPRVSFSTYWEKVVERSSKKRASVSSAPVSTEDATVAESKAIDRHLIQNPASDTHKTNESVLPLHQSSEDQWIDLRVRLNHFLKNDDTTPEQVTTLLSSCIFSYGDQLGRAASDLLHGLLHVIDPATLSDEDRCLVIENLARLKQVPENKPDDGEITETLSSAVDAPVQKHQYDETGFGSQDRLIEKIRASKGQVSLDHLLESIKYASLVES
ncbi:MinD/ParA family protein [Alkalimarinus alittae]|uniref:MinD/ParA family protein n=1 Tax=Alkalimarinus alittae TaxID=2961619 RepID=A0ABY6N560_9ALTE|nr:MinD/ParA family protein [Alkalimarinus alittae]UZE97149.1 MinD/ParA family protein [Alkalimarinus alittae]